MGVKGVVSDGGAATACEGCDCILAPSRSATVFHDLLCHDCDCVYVNFPPPPHLLSPRRLLFVRARHLPHPLSVQEVRRVPGAYTYTVRMGTRWRFNGSA